MNRIDSRTLRAKVDGITNLPTVPKVLQQLSVILENPKVSLDEIADFVSKDPALTAKILKMVNSAIYGFPGRISSVSHAIMLLGLNVVKCLLLGVTVFDLMQRTMVGLREHSIGCAIVARVIAGRRGLKEPEEVSVAALIHDIGKVILMLTYPGEYQSAMNEAEAKGHVIVEAEGNYFSENHAIVGTWLAEKWRFPRNLVEVIQYHHEPHMSKIAPTETAIVHFSDILVRARGLGYAGDPFVPVVQPAVFEMLEITEEDIKEALIELEDSLEALEEVFQEG